VYVRFGGEYMETYCSNTERRWVLSLHHATIFPVATLIIIDIFMQKMRRLKGVRKVICIEEAWVRHEAA